MKRDMSLWRYLGCRIFTGHSWFYMGANLARCRNCGVWGRGTGK